MERHPVVLCLVGVAVVGVMARAQPQPADLVLSNGKVVTVDGRFSIASAVAIRPFTTLWWSVTGKIVGGQRLLRQTISREQALVAHTRSNAYLLFRERDLGSIETGKLADLAVLDRDYLTMPADQIKDITSVMTIVGGRVVHQG
jgi:predicted amidohydrolase YtcJ